ncbi:MAG TPA: CaiB/BaiF CoA-transferase family protein, partial [Roseiflexaceae bacterium]|nr:CaiB/BaiF CoA-transferase family protein [Roseiflexaceae bacterium]
MQPLAGVSVLDLTRLLPGGLCSLILADLGADVLKIEEPGRGDYLRAFPPLGHTQSALFTALNRGKRSITINLKSEAGCALLLDLVRRADVLLEGFRPGVLERLGVGYDVLHDANPRLIVCAISGYGQAGPLRDRVGHDLNYLGYAGALPLFAPRGGGLPIVPGLQIADLGGGALTAAVGILAALLERGRTGQGQVLDIAMTDGVLHWLAALAAEQWATGAVPPGGRGPLSGGCACYSVYATADNRALTVAAVEGRFWANLCRMIEREAFVPLQYAAWPEQERMFADLNHLFASRTLAEWMEFFGDAEVCVGPALMLAEALELHAD